MELSSQLIEHIALMARIKYDNSDTHRDPYACKKDVNASGTLALIPTGNHLKGARRRSRVCLLDTQKPQRGHGAAVAAS